MVSSRLTVVTALLFVGAGCAPDRRNVPPESSSSTRPDSAEAVRIAWAALGAAIGVDTLASNAAPVVARFERDSLGILIEFESARGADPPRSGLVQLSPDGHVHRVVVHARAQPTR